MAEMPVIDTAVSMFEQWGNMLIADGFTQTYATDKTAEYKKGDDTVTLRANAIGARVHVSVIFNLPRFTEVVPVLDNQPEEATAHIGKPAQCIIEHNHSLLFDCNGQEHYCETHECFYIHPGPCPKEHI